MPVGSITMYGQQKYAPLKLHDFVICTTVLTCSWDGTQAVVRSGHCEVKLFDKLRANSASDNQKYCVSVQPLPINSSVLELFVQTGGKSIYIYI